MAITKPLIIFSYDISRTSRRRRIAALLEEHGVRVQYSVFECRMPVRAAQKLLGTLDLMRDPDDSVRMYVIPEDGRRESRTCGGAPIAEKSGFYLL